eukprot:SAG11_NODE_273_length_11315_cov_38.599412_5_plen_1009_part_00
MSSGVALSRCRCCLALGSARGSGQLACSAVDLDRYMPAREEIQDLQAKISRATGRWPGPWSTPIYPSPIGLASHRHPSVAQLRGQVEEHGVLNLGTSWLVQLPAGIDELADELKSLDLGFNPQLALLPTGLFSLRNLEQLCLRSCPGLAALPEEVGQLGSLKGLCLSDNPQLTSLPAVVGRLEHLTRLDIDGCPGLATLHTLQEKGGLAAVQGFLRDLANWQGPLLRVSLKVVLVGPTEAGKTSLLRALMFGEQRKLADKDTERTIGLDIYRLVLGHLGNGVPIELVVYDAGGHGEYQELMQAFFSSDALYLLFWDISKPLLQPIAAELSRWVALIASSAPGAPLLLVGSHADATTAEQAAAACLVVQKRLHASMAANHARLWKELDTLVTDAVEIEKANEHAPERKEDAVEQSPRTEPGAHTQHSDSGSGAGADQPPPSPPPALPRRSSAASARRISELQRLLESPVQLLPNVMTVSAKTLHNVDLLTTRIVSAMFDKSLFPEIGNQIPWAYVAITKQLVRMAAAGRAVVSWPELLQELQSRVEPPTGAAVEVRSLHAALEGADDESHRVFQYELVLDGVAVLAPRARCSEWKQRHQRLQMKFPGVPTFPDSLLDHMCDMTHDDANVARRGEELQAWLQATANSDWSDSPGFLGAMGFDRQTLAEKYGALAIALQQDPPLLRRAMAYLRATGDVLYYEDVPALADLVFIKPLWLVDVMKELVRHDLGSIIGSMAGGGNGALVGAVVRAAEAEQLRLQASAKWFVQEGVVRLPVLKWLWERAGILQPDSAHLLPMQLVQLLRRLSIVLDWRPGEEDQVAQWLMPLRLPQQVMLPPSWSEGLAAASAVGRQYDFGGYVPAGLIAVLLHSVATVIADPVSITSLWRTGLVASLDLGGATRRRVEVALTVVDGAGVRFEARSPAADDHQALLKAMRRFEDVMHRILAQRWRGTVAEPVHVPRLSAAAAAVAAAPAVHVSQRPRTPSSWPRRRSGGAASRRRSRSRRHSMGS